MYSLVSGNETGHKEDAAEKTFLQMLWLVAGCRSCPWFAWKMQRVVKLQ